ncbi:KH domain-containing protein, putative [Eimeria brunetti]|uniref:KH domain-containing protein, putative n=1 Tax=Eimeria brunetti TaxID=51314 RepID=U6L9T8_9EIME|nr:KH domain-containing protein, putative [Eimeria brunetti]
MGSGEVSSSGGRSSSSHGKDKHSSSSSSSSSSKRHKSSGHSSSSSGSKSHSSSSSGSSSSSSSKGSRGERESSSSSSKHKSSNPSSSSSSSSNHSSSHSSSSSSSSLHKSKSKEETKPSSSKSKGEAAEVKLQQASKESSTKGSSSKDKESSSSKDKESSSSSKDKESSRSKRSSSKDKENSSSKDKEGSSSKDKEGSSSKRSSSKPSRDKEGSKDHRSSKNGKRSRSSSRSRDKKRKREKSPSYEPPPVVNTTDPTKNSLGDPLPPDLEGPCYLKLLPQQRDVSILLGVDNRGLLNLAKSHGCKARLSPKDVFFPETNRRMLLLQGELERLQQMLQQALQRIAEPAKHRDSSSSSSSSSSEANCSVTFILPHAVCLLQLAGTEEQQQPLKKIKRIGKVKVHISDKRDMKKQGGRERLVTLQGPLGEVQRVSILVLQQLETQQQQQQLCLRDYANLKYDSCKPKPDPEEMEKKEERLEDLLGQDLDQATVQALASILIPPKEEPVKAGIASVAPNVPNLSDSAKAALISQAQDELARISNLQYMRDTRPVLMQGPAYHKVLVSDLVAAQLLGSNGSIISQFEAEYNVQVKVAPPEPPPCTERIVVISGQPMDTDRALLAVLEKVYAACLMVGHANFMVWRMSAMSTCCALICGPGGQRIRQLASFTGTRIQISNRDQQTPAHHPGQLVPSNPHERIISVLGPLEQVTIAIKAMLPYIHADPNQSLSVHQNYGHGYKLKMPAWAETGVLQEGMNMEALKEVPLEDERPVSLPGPFHMKLLIDPALANSLIGPQSETISRVAAECGCSMHVLSSKNKFPDSGDRLLLMSGATEAISAGVIALLERCKEVHPNLPYDQMYAKLVVPTSVCPTVIGPGGVRVREIREATLTRITVDRNSSPCPERVIAIHGMAQGVHQAAVAISTIAQTDPSLVLMLELQYDYLEQQQETQQQQAQLDSSIVGAVLEGVLSVSNKVGGGVATDVAVKRLEGMKQAAAAQAPLGPMGQHTSGNMPNYDAPVSFVTASNSNSNSNSSGGVSAEAAKSFALAQRAAQALGNDPRVRLPSPPAAAAAADEWEQQQREIQLYEQQRLAGHVEVYSSSSSSGKPAAAAAAAAINSHRAQPGDPAAAAAAAAAVPPPPPPPPNNDMDADDGDPLLEGLMNEAF